MAIRPSNRQPPPVNTAPIKIDGGVSANPYTGSAPVPDFQGEAIDPYSRGSALGFDAANYHSPEKSKYGAFQDHLINSLRNNGPEYGDQQGQFINQLMAQSQGQGPSLANLVANQQREAGLKNIMSMTASSRGSNPALAFRGAQMGAANLNGQINQQAIQGRLMEQMQAQQMLNQAMAQGNSDVLGHQGLLNNVITGARGQDQNFQQMAVNRDLGVYGQELGAAGQVMDRHTAIDTTAMGGDIQKDMKNTEARRKMQGGMAESGATAIVSMMSDKRTKHKVEDISDKDLNEFLRAVKPKKFTYKNQAHPLTAKGERVGFMMQDIEKTKLGKAMTRKTEDGYLAYDKDNLQGILLAGLSKMAKSK